MPSSHPKLSHCPGQSGAYRKCSGVWDARAWGPPQELRIFPSICSVAEGLQTFDSVMMLQGLGVPEFCLLLH